MANHIIIPSKVDSSRETKIFGAISPDVFQAILDSIPAICRAVLNWEPLAVWFIAEIIRQVPLSGELLYLGHLEFGRVLFGDDISDVGTRQRIGRAIKSVKRCQLLSAFKAVDIQSGDMIESHGKKEYFPTSYQLKDFFVVFFEFQNLATEQDLMALPQRQRKQTQFAIAKSICDARGYVAIPKRERKEKSERGGREPKSKAEQLRREPNEDFEKDLEWFADRYKQELREKYSLGRKFAFTVKHVYNVLEMAENEAREMIVNVKTNGGLRLVGGQPK